MKQAKPDAARQDSDYDASTSLLGDKGNPMLDLIHGFLTEVAIVEVNVQVEQEAGGQEVKTLTVKFY